MAVPTKKRSRKYYPGGVDEKGQKMLTFTIIYRLILKPSIELKMILKVKLHESNTLMENRSKHNVTNA